jgi:hypothetical protein
MDGDEKATCISCQQTEHIENTVKLVVTATIDGRSPKYKARVCMFCWIEGVEPKLELTVPAQSTGSLWES